MLALRLGFGADCFLNTPVPEWANSGLFWIKGAQSHWCLHCLFPTARLIAVGWKSCCAFLPTWVAWAVFQRQTISCSASSCPNIKSKQFSTLRTGWSVLFFNLQESLLRNTNSLSPYKGWDDAKKSILPMSSAEITASSTQEFMSRNSGEKYLRTAKCFVTHWGSGEF